MKGTLLRYHISGYEWELLEERGYLAGATTQRWYEYFLATNYTEYLERILQFYQPAPDDSRVLGVYAQADFIGGRVEIPTDTRLLSALAKNPAKLLALSWREFERFTAEMLERFGYKDVQLGLGSKDNGVDVTAALVHPLGVERIIVQCKRFSPRRKVGVPCIVQLLGSIDVHAAARGLIVTTSSLTAPAEFMVESKSHKLHALDQAKLVEILQEFSRASSTSSRGVPFQSAMKQVS